MTPTQTLGAVHPLPNFPASVAIALLLLSIAACGTDTPPNTGVQDVAVWTGISDAGANTSSGGTTSGGSDATTDTNTSGSDAVTGADSETPDAGPADTGPAGPGCGSASGCFKHEDTPYCDTPNQVCVQCLIKFHCEKKAQADWEEAKKSDPTAEKLEYECVSKKCVEPSCQPNSSVCKGAFLQVCKADGKGYDLKACPDVAPICVVNKCLKCLPNDTYCADPTGGQKYSSVLMKCNSAGKDADIHEICKANQICTNGKCQQCVAGLKQCNGNKAVECKSDGSGFALLNDCDAKGLTCLAGVCVNPCASDLKSNTNVGCDYYAVDLDNALIKAAGNKVYDAQNSQFSVIISNTKSAKALVTVTAGTGQAAKYEVPALGVRVINLPDPIWKMGPLNQDGSSFNLNSYRIQSNQPIVAYQFNPLQNVDVFSNDASLLLPSNALGKKYWVMTREQSHPAFRGYFTIVAVTSGITTIKVLASAPVLAGGGMGQQIPGGTWAGLKEFKLTKGQVMNVETGVNGADFTGSFIDADKPIAVFGGSEASNAPRTNKCVKGPGQPQGTCQHQGWPCSSDQDCPVTCCADHLEEQLLPVSGWGTVYPATRSQPRGKAKDVWRVLAAESGTVVTTIPPQTNIPVLNQGQWHEFESNGDFLIKSNKKIMVGQFLAGASAPKPNNDLCSTKYGFQTVCTGFDAQFKTKIPCKKHSDCPNLPEADDASIGDPAFIIGVAVDRFLQEFVFLVPGKYQQNYINVISPLANNVTLDGNAIPNTKFTPFGDGKWMVLRLPVLAGAHNIKATKPIGVVVYGWDKDVSYGYPAGLKVLAD